MSETPGDLKYSKSHEWVRIDDNDLLTVGITDHAQAALGDMVFVETPEIGVTFEAEDACAVVESVKAASDVYCPVGGEVIETNASLVESPEKVNDDPYGEGWIFQIRVSDVDELNSLMESGEYEMHCTEAD